VITCAVYLFLSGFALFLLGFSIFMYFENRKFGDNQFTVKLLPPPSRMTSPLLDLHAQTLIADPIFVREEKVTGAFSEAA
jgi:hypothetical protein